MKPLRPLALGLAGLPLLVSVSAQKAFAWGNTGHQTVAYIANAYLQQESPTAAAKVLSILKVGPAKFNDSLVDAATWPDFVRTQSTPQFPLDWTFSGAYHFADLPVAQQDYFDFAHFPIAPAGDVVQALIHYEEELRNPSAIVGPDGNYPNQSSLTPDLQAVEQATALRYIIHFVGDSHQPLHCADQGGGTSNDDRGGNLINVVWQLAGGGSPTPTNRYPVDELHALWDNGIIDQIMADGDGNGGAITTVEELGNYVIAQDQKLGLTHKNDGTDFADWANESHKDAVNAAYYDQTTNTQMVKNAANNPYTLGKAYYAIARPIVMRHLAEAGRRLADLLIRDLGTATPGVYTTHERDMQVAVRTACSSVSCTDFASPKAETQSFVDRDNRDKGLTHPVKKNGLGAGG